MQEYAHQIPKFRNVIADIGKDHIQITFSYDEDGKPTKIRVYGRTMTGKFHRTERVEWEEWDSWGLVIEPKAYMDSQHATRISNGEEKALEWLKNLMGGIEPEPRFQLSKFKGPVRAC